MAGFLSGGAGGGAFAPPWKLAAPLERPTSHILILNYINFDIVHVESFPLLMAKAVLNECFAHFTLLNFRVLRRRKQSLSLLVFNSFCYLSSSIHVQAPCIHCVVDLSLQIEADSLFTGLAFPAELSNYICYCTWSLKPLEVISDAENKFFWGSTLRPP